MSLCCIRCVHHTGGCIRCSGCYDAAAAWIVRSVNVIGTCWWGCRCIRLTQTLANANTIRSIDNYYSDGSNWKYVWLVFKYILWTIHLREKERRWFCCGFVVYHCKMRYFVGRFCLLCSYLNGYSFGKATIASYLLECSTNLTRTRHKNLASQRDNQQSFVVQLFYLVTPDNNNSIHSEMHLRGEKSVAFDRLLCVDWIFLRSIVRSPKKKWKKDNVWSR